MTFEQIMREARALPIEQRKQLISLLVDSLVESAGEQPTHSILELAGLGASSGEDAQNHVRRPRGEWDERRP